MTKSTPFKPSPTPLKTKGPSAATLQFILNFAATYRVAPSPELQQRIKLSLN